MDNNINENENVQESFTQQDIERLATEKFEQYKYELECNNYLEKNNIPKEIKDIIRFDNMEMLEKNITTLIFLKQRLGLLHPSYVFAKKY